MSRALILTYHAIEPGPPPLRIHPSLFASHLDVVASSGARIVTVGEVADALRAGRPPDDAVAITFDDGLASVARTAFPLLAERGLVATVFCVAGRLGAFSDWPSRASWAPVLPLADATELAELAAAGWEIGSHGLEHRPLVDGDPALLAAELAESRRLLADVVGPPVRSFAYPYGIIPSSARAALREAGYEAACSNRPARVRDGADLYALPRIDAHYVRRPAALRAAFAGRLDAYLGVRRLGRRARRAFRPDHTPA